QRQEQADMLPKFSSAGNISQMQSNFDNFNRSPEFTHILEMQSNFDNFNMSPEFTHILQMQSLDNLDGHIDGDYITQMQANFYESPELASIEINVQQF
ncbi:14754_t:CDS:1, partial [Dentiscutata erythropus]